MMKYQQDLELVNKILSKNEKALRSYYKTYMPKLKAFISRKIDDEKDAEETLQDVLLVSLDAMRDFVGQSSLYTYIYSIAKHKVIDYYRRRKLKQIVFSRIPAIENLISHLNSPEQKYDIKELKEKIAMCFKLLKPRYQEVLQLKYVEGMTVVEISKTTSESIKSVESLLFRARKLFAKVYKTI